MMDKKSAMRCIVTGRVQGVFFRAHTRDKARLLNLSGFAKNLADGSVEVVAYGDEDALEKLRDWLSQGSTLARVDEVQYEKISYQANEGFLVL